LKKHEKLTRKEKEEGKWKNFDAPNDDVALGLNIIDRIFAI